MKAKINEQIICIPPYISTTWDQVSFMRAQFNEMEGLDLVMHLENGSEIIIHNLDKSLIDLAFTAHLKYLETKSPKKENLQPGPIGLLQQLFGMTPDQVDGFPIRLGIAPLSGLEHVEMTMQHDPSKSDTKDLPQELLQRISQLTKMMLGEDLSAFPKPNTQCNCPHCQIARSVHGIPKDEMDLDEEVSDQDLRLRDWTVQEIGDQLYTVIHPLDPDEQYQVYLGSPIGCTCGQPHCEHITTVLRS